MQIKLCRLLTEVISAFVFCHSKRRAMLKLPEMQLVFIFVRITFFCYQSKPILKAMILHTAI